MIILSNKEKEFENIFDKYDSNRYSNITSDELANILKAININLSNKEIKEI